MIRLFDILLSIIALALLAPIIFVIYLLVLIETKSPVYVQERVGHKQRAFILYKFRTMKSNTPSLATHLVSESVLTATGRLLRKTKFDELPQLINVLRGEMSLVGPRPCLFNQSELILARDRLGVFQVLPGITGLSQLRKIDMSTPELLAKTDAEMIRNFSLTRYFRYLVLTALGMGAGDRIDRNSNR
ncbi:MAG: sugar transferase [Gammaproteobacteria bacterium]|nr:sugar transferase [Gammaproteobacteria bacterium]MCY4338415.1 sugar transferase [Gammaproteobacteria bacterium]